MWRYINTIVALKAISSNKLRFFVSSFGICIGITAIISFFALKNGINSQITDELKVIGNNNLIIIDKNQQLNTLTNDDAINIKKTIIDSKLIGTEISYKTKVSNAGTCRDGMLSGINYDFFTLLNFNIIEGQYFIPFHFIYSNPVCIISSDLKTTLFNNQSPIGKLVKCKNLYLKVIGVFQLQSKYNLPQSLQFNYLSDVVFAPIQTLNLRYEVNNENMINPQLSIISQNNLNKIIIHFENNKQIKISKELIKRILLRRHQNIEDFEILIPEQVLMEKHVNSKIILISLIVLSFVSLIIAGIGLHNYVNTAVLEREKDVKILYVLGATKFNIIYQFIFQGIFVCFIGGLFGIIFGMIISRLIFEITNIPTLVTLYSIILSFIISLFVGFLFSILPSGFRLELQ